MKRDRKVEIQDQALPILLYNDECGVCRFIGHWVQRSAKTPSGKPSLIVRPIGEDPDELRSLNPKLVIWDAYATIHLLMPDGSMKLGGEAVAGVFRNIPATSWLAGLFRLSVFGWRPFQAMLNVAYAILADIRPIFGCESCGEPRPWIRPLRWIVKWLTSVFGKSKPKVTSRHFTPLATKARTTSHLPV
jgi:hypothetical protein